MKISCIFGHKWSGCICERCGTVRDGEQLHSFVHFDHSCATKCERCGREGPVQHTWNRNGKGCTCEICGAKREVSNLNAHSIPYIYDPHYLGGSERISCTCTDCGYVRPGDFEGHIYEYTYVEGSAEHKGVCIVCGREIMSEHFYEDGVCKYCGYKPGVDLQKLVRDFATYTSLSLDESALDEMERQLLDVGDPAEAVIFNFLWNCSMGSMDGIRWWSQARRLTRMLPKFRSPELKQQLTLLVDNATRNNSWEYHTEIANVAKEELSKIL
ncbi:MAG: hypothetical protein QM270_07530 [Bacillota bacterium]|nr:hypothetical protein [Bacillota bacterium]